jgi:hypothetical protein
MSNSTRDGGTTSKPFGEDFQWRWPESVMEMLRPLVATLRPRRTGKWDVDAFAIHTLYPGLRAPREIHDLDLTLSELPHTIKFWRNHAIITQEGSYSRDPH